jgi:hypothetical protein
VKPARTALLGSSLVAGGCVDIDPRFYLGNACQNASDDVVFCTDFEEGNLETWNDFDENPEDMNDVVPDDGPFGIAGNHVVRMRVAPSENGTDLVKQLPGFYDALYARWWVKLEPGYDLDISSALWPGLHAGGHDLLGVAEMLPSGDDRFTVLTSHDIATHGMITKLDYRGMYQDCADPVDACYRDELPCTRDEGESFCIAPQHRETQPLTAIEKSRWYCVELFVDAGTPVSSAAEADGRVSLWLDDELLFEYGELWFRTSAALEMDVLWMTQYTSGGHGDEGVLYDDVLVSRSRIGCN